jgi:hypothetical protein
MPNVDQFESVFNAAAKTPYVYQPVKFENAAVLTDLEQPQADQLTSQMRDWLKVLGDQVRFTAYAGQRSLLVDDLLAVIEQDKPDLIITYRNLHSPGWQWPHTLGRRLDVLSQATKTPILVIPHPQDDAFENATENTDRVMAMTDHLSGDHQLVNTALCFTQTAGQLMLTHVEDDQTFTRYIDTIAKIPTIDTDLAREEILKQLLKEPADYIDSCINILKEHHINITTQSIIRTGHHLNTYRKLIDDHKIDLLVINTKDQDQLAMHGLAYPLAVEMRTTPLLLL